MLLLDNSAWARLGGGALPAERADAVAAWMIEGDLAVCLPFLLEAGYSARSASDHRAMMADLDRLPRVEIDRDIERLALGAQGELARAGHHRLAPADIVIAACAHQAGAGVLHYDRDYDVLSEYTSLTFDSEWLAPAGAL